MKARIAELEKQLDLSPPSSGAGGVVKQGAHMVSGPPDCPPDDDVDDSPSMKDCDSSIDSEHSGYYLLHGNGKAEHVPHADVPDTVGVPKADPVALPVLNTLPKPSLKTSRKFGTRQFPSVVHRSQFDYGTDTSTRATLPGWVHTKLPHAAFKFGVPSLPNSQVTIYTMVDSGAMINTWKLSDALDLIEKCPDIVHAVVDSRALLGYKPLPLSGAIGSEDALQAVTTFLPVSIWLKTGYYDVATDEPILAQFYCGNDLAITTILGAPMLHLMKASLSYLDSRLVIGAGWNVPDIPIRFQTPSSSDRQYRALAARITPATTPQESSLAGTVHALRRRYVQHGRTESRLTTNDGANPFHHNDSRNPLFDGRLGASNERFHDHTQTGTSRAAMNRQGYWAYGISATDARDFLRDEGVRMRADWPSNDRRELYRGDGYRVKEVVNFLTGTVCTTTQGLTAGNETGQRCAWSSASTPWTAPGNLFDHAGRRQNTLYTKAQRKEFNVPIRAARASNRAAANLPAEVESTDDEDERG